MREIRQSGSEGGEPQPNAASLPLSRRGWRQEAARGRRWMVLNEGGAWVSTAWRQWLREEGGYKRRWLRGSGGDTM